MEMGPFHCKGDGHISLVSRCDHPFALIDLPMKLPSDGFELGGCVLSRPTKEQIPLIREHLLAVAPESKYQYRFECEPVDEGRGITAFSELPSDDFRYATLQFSGNQESPYSVQEASNICDLEFNIIGTWLPYGQVGRSVPAQSVLWDWKGVLKPSVVVSNAHIQELRDVLGSISEARKLVPVFIHAIDLCDAIKVLPRRSPFRAVASFSLVELLIVDGAGSRRRPITEQIRRKIPEICERSMKMGYPRMPLTHWSDHNFWKAMYGVRSGIAHNGTTRFPPKGVFGLHDVEAVCEELSKLNKFLLRACIVDPHFMSGIKLK